MSPFWRRFAVVLHIAASAGWIGAVAASLVLALAGLTTPDERVARAAYLVLEPLGWWALVPFSAASLLTGVVLAAGTRWGLTRHYWVLLKLLMNLFATGVLLLYMRTLAALAALAADPDLGVDRLRTASPAGHAAAAIGLLLVALVPSVVKPRGVTPWAA